MAPVRLFDRYQPCTLQPNQNEHDKHLVDRLASNGVFGSVFHLLNYIPEQGEDLYTILIDDREVAIFEVPRGCENSVADELTVTPLADYRRSMPQGKSRIRLDRAVQGARALLSR